MPKIYELKVSKNSENGTTTTTSITSGKPNSSPLPAEPISSITTIPRIFRTFDWHEFACGCGAAFINIGVTYPIYKMIFRQMLHGVKFTSAFSQLRHEGITYLYRGMFPPLAQKTISLSIMFGVYDGTRRQLVEDFHANQYVAKVAAGLVAGTVELLLLPFERVQTLLADSKFHQHFQNTPQAFKYVWNNHGFKELYRGLVPVLWRNGPSNAMFFVLREEANSLLPERKSHTSKTAQEFLAGAIIGATISTVFYPFNVLKVAMQSEMGHKHETMIQAFNKLYASRGYKLRYFYRGCLFNTSRSFISWGIMNTAYENLKKIIS